MRSPQVGCPSPHAVLYVPLALRSCPSCATSVQRRALLHLHDSPMTWRLHAGGELTKVNSGETRQRTPGGIFLKLAKKRWGPAPDLLLFGLWPSFWCLLCKGVHGPSSLVNLTLVNLLCSAHHRCLREGQAQMAAAVAAAPVFQLRPYQLQVGILGTLLGVMLATALRWLPVFAGHPTRFTYMTQQLCHPLSQAVEHIQGDPRGRAVNWVVAAPTNTGKTGAP